MTKDHDHELNAYLDGELSDSQRLEVERLLEGDQVLNQRLDDFRRLKATISACYQTGDLQLKTTAPSIHRRSKQYLVASALLVVGFLLGAITMGTGGNRFVVLDHEGRGQAPSEIGSHETRIVFHLTNPDQVVAGDLLDEVETLLSRYRDQDALLRVEIVSHGAGLGLLRQRLTRHQQRIADLTKNYDNLAFVACQNTINRLEVEKGLEVTLVPEAIVVDSGVSYVVKRQMEGWSYIRV